jgi:hypothetical protein
MNLIEQAERLKTLPDQELVQMQQRPTMIAPFLVLAEMQRRETMRKAATSGQDPVQQTTVAQEMSSRLAQMQPQQPQQPQQQTQQMRTGGAVRAANGLPMEMPPTLASESLPAGSDFASQLAGMQNLPRRPLVTNPGMMPFLTRADMEREQGPPPDIAETLARIRAIRGESPLVALSEQLKQREEQVRGQRQSLGETLMRLGLGMAASRRPDFLGAVGEGGMSALQGYVQNRDLTRKEAADLLRHRMAVEAQRQQSDDVLFREAGDLARAEQYGRVSAMQTTQAGRNALLNQMNEDVRAQEKQRKDEEIAKENRRFELDKQQAKSQDEWAQKYQQHLFNLDEIKARAQYGGTGGGGGGSTREDKQLNTLDLAINRNNAAIESLYKRRNTAPASQQDAIDERIAELEFRGDRLVEGQMIRMEQLGIVPVIQAKRSTKPSPPPPTTPPAQGESSLQRFLKKYFSGPSQAARPDNDIAFGPFILGGQ